MTNNPIVKHVKPHRRLGSIPKLTGNTFPKEYIFFDTETHIVKTDKHTIIFPMRLGIAIYIKLDKDHNIIKRTVLRFDSANDFIDILSTYCKGKKTIYCLAHNIKFDIMVMNLPLALHDKGYKSRLPIINERMFIWNVYINKAKALMIDTANFCVISVEQLGKDLGRPKQEVNFEDVDTETLFGYCRNDVEILEEFILSYVKFIHTNELGTFRLTLASQAMAAWRKRFMHYTAVIHDNEQALKLERSSYHGGRTECYYIGDAPEEPYYYVDINSMYPFIMKSSNVPTELLKRIDTNDLDKLYNCLMKYYIIADVEIDTNLAAYPLVYGDKLLFPHGNFRTTLHHRELSYAMEHGHIKKVFSLAIYSFHNIFGYYVDWFYDMKQRTKQEGNKSWNVISKYFLNSLYGKFAQTGVVQEIIEGPYERIIEREEGHELHTFNYEAKINWFGTIIREKHEGESSYSFPAIGGAITANSRMYLWQLIECSGLGNVYYCDTDSLILNKTGYDNLRSFMDETNLGMLKLERMSNYLSIWTSKDYEIGEVKHHKGISLKAEQLTRNKWKALQFGGIYPWMNAGTNIAPSAKYIIKERKETYNKGIIQPDGRVIPYTFHLNEGVYEPLH